ncbi:SWIM zinc finger family protein [Saprospiraceae bacterium]|nr:SWIM zinc finger family protein [Saprospiraceae bacterium]
MSISIYKIEEVVSSDMMSKAQAIVNAKAISSIEQIGTHNYNALVKGTEIYTVHIALDNTLQLYTHRCDCPYDTSPLCKHKVAVIYLLRKKMSLNEDIPEGVLARIDKRLVTFNKKELQQLVLELAKQSYKSRQLISGLIDL